MAGDRRRTGLQAPPVGGRWAWMLQAIGLAAGYSLVDELHQAFVPNRTASLPDRAIDSLGAVVSQVFIYLRHLTRTCFGMLR